MSEYLPEYFSKFFSELQSSIPTLSLLSLAGLFLSAWISYFIFRNLLIKLILLAVKDVKNFWAQAFLERTFLFRVSWLVPLLIVHTGLNAIPDLDPKISTTLQRVVLVLFAIFCARAISALLLSINASYNTLAISRNRPIKSMLQVLSLLVYSAALILILSIILNKSPWVFLSGLGAMTAILILIFKDTILSLVAGLQITTNDFIRVGDWVEMPQFEADGDVIDIALHAVQIQNFDRTITTIPTHKFLEHSYKNWRGMQTSGGRRIKRSVQIDMGTVRFLNNEEIEKFKNFHLLSKYIEDKTQELARINQELSLTKQAPVNKRRLTNVGTFRAYLANYLRSHPKIHQGMTVMVRQLSPGSDGLPLEIYAFTNTTDWDQYENIQSDIFDHILAIAPEFGLRVFQQPSGTNFESAFKTEDGSL